MIEPVEAGAVEGVARALLIALRDGQPRSVSRLALHLTCTPRRIVAAMEMLNHSDCVLESGPGGVVLRQTHWKLWRSVLEEISAQRGTVLGRHVLVYDRIGSTNDVCRQVAAAGLPGFGTDESLVVLAEQQSAGRGRQGRRWESAAGQSLLMSVLFPAQQESNAESIGLCAAIACAACVEKLTRQPVNLKWPNDILMGGRKVAGILVETLPVGGRSPGGTPRSPAIILGIGINVAQREGDFPPDLGSKAGSLYTASGRHLDRLTVADELLGQIERCCLPTLSPEQIAAEWKQRCHLVNRMVRLMHRGVELRGRVTDLDPSVGLVITDADGRKHFAGAAATSVVEM